MRTCYCLPLLFAALFLTGALHPAVAASDDAPADGTRLDSSRVAGERVPVRDVSDFARAFASAQSGTALSSSIAEPEAIEYVREVWEIADISDGVIRETLAAGYNGIPFKDWINGLIEAPKVLVPLANENGFVARRLI